MAGKVTVMVLKVDLQCPSCYKKIKKILCEIPQITGQVYDVKQNTVTVTVVCCSPEKIRDKLCCKARNVIKCIEIKVNVIKPPPPPDDHKKDHEIKPPPPPDDHEKDHEIKPPPPPDDHEKGPACVRVKKCPPPRTCCGPCSEGYGGGPCYHGHGAPLTLYPPARTCCGPCSEGYGGGPCYHGHGDPPPVYPPARTCCGPCSEGYSGGPCYHGHGDLPPCYDGYYAYGCGCGRGCQMGRCVLYIEENPSACMIM